MCRLILFAYKTNKESFPKLTLRNIVRLIDSTFLLQQKFKSKLDFPSSLWAAYHVTIASQIKGDLKRQVSDDVKKLLLRNRPTTQILYQPKFTEWIEESNEHILTRTRQEYANAVLGSVACNIPLLLEGPAAVGKTAIISYLCKYMKSEFVNSHESKMRLERVNNTDTTTIQDYLGTFLPANKGFIFQQGALYRAMVSFEHISQY
jgi:MoxR-like ATPase